MACVHEDTSGLTNFVEGCTRSRRLKFLFEGLELQGSRAEGILERDEAMARISHLQAQRRVPSQILGETCTKEALKSTDMRDLAHDVGFLFPHLTVELFLVARLLVGIFNPTADIPVTPHNGKCPLPQSCLLQP